MASLSVSVPPAASPSSPSSSSSGINCIRDAAWLRDTDKKVLQLSPQGEVVCEGTAFALSQDHNNTPMLG
eukprot:9798556-Karenia_brevis.AAC.1